MARHFGRCLLAAFGFALALGLSPAAELPAVRAAPTRPSAPALWPITRIFNTDCIDVRDIADRFGLKLTRAKGGKVVQLVDGTNVRLSFEDHSRDFYFEGLRIFLGQPAIAAKDTLWLAKIDVIKLVELLLRPSDHLAFLPAAAPRTIVLDAGHGGNDPGKENTAVGVNEKTLTLDVVLRLKKILEARGWRVLLTRAADTRLAPDQVTDLQRRAEFANNNKADLFVSVHFNSVEKDAARVTGVETYSMAPQFMLSTADDKKDEMTDKAFPGNKSDYANFLFGEKIHRAMIGTLKASDRGYKRGRLHVLRFIECPGVLVECGYLSHDAEARRIATAEYREQLAHALAEGLQNYSAALEALRPKLPAPSPAATTARPKSSP